MREGCKEKVDNCVVTVGSQRCEGPAQLPRYLAEAQASVLGHVLVHVGGVVIVHHRPVIVHTVVGFSPGGVVGKGIPGHHRSARVQVLPSIRHQVFIGRRHDISYLIMICLSILGTKHLRKTHFFVWDSKVFVGGGIPVHTAVGFSPGGEVGGIPVHTVVGLSPGGK